MSSPLKSLVIWLTFRCNYKCVYCSAQKLARAIGAEHQEEAAAEKWLSALNNLSAATIDLTGGEPFLHSGIYDIINGLDEKHYLGVTTNLSLLDVVDIVKRLPERKRISWTLSFHPTQCMNLEEFTEKAIFLKRKYEQVSVNYVASPVQMTTLARYHQHFTSCNLKFHVDPDMFHDYTAEEKQMLSAYVLKDRIIEDADELKMCRAGVHHAHVMPDGTVFKCYYYRQSLGNLFSEYHLYTSAQVCHFNCRSGCDLDKISPRAEAMAYVDEQYRQILNRDAEPLGRENYVELILKGMMKAEALPTILMSSREYLEMHAQKNKVLVAFLVRDGAKWLDRFLACLDRLDYPQESLRYAMIEGNSKDDSWNMLNAFAIHHDNVWLKKLDVEDANGGDTVFKRSARLGILRNKLIDEALKDEGYVFWLDSDIVEFPRSLLNDLIKADVDIVAPYVLIENSGLFYDTLAFRRDGLKFGASITNGNASLQRADGSTVSCLPNQLFQVDSVGTCMLVKANVYRKGVRFGENHPESEQVEFCRSAQTHGFKVYVDPCVRVFHAELPRYGVAFH